jgi:hypothetical protein
MLRFGLVRVFGSAVLVLALGACGDDDEGEHEHDAGGDSGAADSGMDAAAGSSGGGSGGSGGSGGTSGSGGGGAGGTPAPDAGEPYQCEPVEAEPEPGGDAEEGELCCSGLGVCTKNVSGEGTAAYGLDDCKADEALKCVPAAQGGEDAGTDDDAGSEAALATCRMSLSGDSEQDIEGRCIPSCFLTGDPSTANLDQATCDDGNRCVPCYSPITGESTGACNRDGDAPVEPAPPGFAECGDEATGYCIPGGASGSGATLPQLTCDDGQVCAPKSRVLDQGSCFARCESGFGPGACIPSFIVGEQATLLQMATCEAGEVCTPCISPINQSRTGACD